MYPRLAHGPVLDEVSAGAGSVLRDEKEAGHIHAVRILDCGQMMGNGNGHVAHGSLVERSLYDLL